MSTVNEIFTQVQRDLLTAVLNRIVPADDRFPGAGDLGGAAFVERAVGNTSAVAPAVQRRSDPN